MCAAFNAVVSISFVFIGTFLSFCFLNDFAIVLGVLRMQFSHNEYDVCNVGTAANSNTIHIRVFNVCGCTVDFNNIGEQCGWPRNNESCNREKTCKTRFKSYSICDVLVWIEIYSNNYCHGAWTSNWHQTVFICPETHDFYFLYINQ